MAQMSKTMQKYFDDLYRAEFGDEEQEIEANDKEFVRLLKRALKWKSYDNLAGVCEYLGSEDDDRVETVDGCKAIIKENIDYMQKEVN